MRQYNCLISHKSFLNLFNPNFYRTVQFPNRINPVRIFGSYFLMSVMIFTSDFYTSPQSVLFPSVSVSDSTDNVRVSLDFFSVSSLSVEVH